MTHTFELYQKREIFFENKDYINYKKIATSVQFSLFIEKRAIQVTHLSFQWNIMTKQQVK